MWTKKIPIVEGFYRIKDDDGNTAVVYVAPRGGPMVVGQDVWFWPVPVPPEHAGLFVGEEADA